MLKNKLIVGVVGFTAFAFALVGISGTVSAASISNTGPGSTNIIRGGHGGSIYNTGPYSKNVIKSNGYGYKNHKHMKKNHYKSDHKKSYKKASYKKKSNHNKYYKKAHHRYNKCDNHNIKYWGSWSNWQEKCCDKYAYKHSRYCKDEKKHKYTSWYVKPYYCNHKGHYPKKMSYDYPRDHYKKDHKKHYNKDHHKPKKHSKKHHHKKHHKSHPLYKIMNKNNVNVHNNTNQYAKSGNAVVKYNTYGGHARTGNAHNKASTASKVNINNSTSNYKPAYKAKKVVIKNVNNVNVKNNTNQKAVSGNAVVKYNTKGGNATTGNASNKANTSTHVNINNAFGGGNIYAKKLKIVNKNNVNVYNNTSQTAKSGNAVVKGNTHGGNATTGNASNYSNTTTNIGIKN